MKRSNHIILFYDLLRYIKIINCVKSINIFISNQHFKCNEIQERNQKMRFRPTCYSKITKLGMIPSLTRAFQNVLNQKPFNAGNQYVQPIPEVGTEAPQ